MNEKAWRRLTGNIALRFIGKSSTTEEIRKTFYRAILINMFWTDGDLPDDPDKKIEFVLNSRWADPSNPSNYIGLRHLSEEMLFYLCGRLKRPEWVDSPRAVRATMSFNEMVQQWPFLFDLTK